MSIFVISYKIINIFYILTKVYRFLQYLEFFIECEFINKDELIIEIVVFIYYSNYNQIIKFK